MRGLYRDNGVSLVELNHATSMDIGYWLALPYFIRRDRRSLADSMSNADLVISSMFPENWIALSRGSYKTAQYCFEPYAPFFDKNFIARASWGKRAFYRISKIFYGSRDLKATQAADVVWTLGETNAEWVLDTYGRRAILTGEGVDTTEFTRKRDVQIWNRYTGCALIMHSTDYTAIKGTEYLLRAMVQVAKEVPNVKLLITTCYPGSAREKSAKKMAAELGIDSAVEFVGFVESSMLPECYSSVDVVVQPSIDQPMSLSVKEAMACGAAVVRSGGGESELIHGVNGWRVPERDVPALASGIVKLLRDRELRDRIGIAAAEYAIKTWSWEAVSSRIWDDISKLCDGSQT